MNKADFSAMQRQLTPSPQARAALEARLESAPPKRPPPYCPVWPPGRACL